MIILSLIGLTGYLEADSFESLSISKTEKDKTPLASIVGVQDGQRYIFRKQNKKEPVAADLELDDVIKLVEDYTNRGCNFIKVISGNALITYEKIKGKWKINRQPIISKKSEVLRTFDERAIKESKKLSMLLTELGITTENGVFREKQKQKFYQVRDFIDVFTDSLKRAELFKNSQLTLWDAACGKSYLSFLLQYYYREKLKMNVKFVCIDMNTKLIKRCNEIKDKMEYDNMHFVANSNLDGIETGTRNAMDVLYCLHACDTATDEAIAMGIQNNAKLIVAAPCCQRELRDQMKGDTNHVLKGITKFPLLKERLADVITDGIRSLLLEVSGYSVKALKFVPSDITPKNLMLVAFKVNKSDTQTPMQNYLKIKEFFHLNPSLERMIEEKI